MVRNDEDIVQIAPKATRLSTIDSLTWLLMGFTQQKIFSHRYCHIFSGQISQNNAEMIKYADYIIISGVVDRSATMGS